MDSTIGQILFGIIQLIFVGGALFLAIWLSKILAVRFPPLMTFWDNGVIPIFLAIITFHLALYWIFPKFWVLLYNQSGFTLYQIVFWFGVYVITMGGKLKKYVGGTIAMLAVIGTGYNIAEAHNGTYILDADTGSKATIEKFWADAAKVPANNLSSAKAEQMVKIAERVSQFNQHEKDGITTLRSKKPGYACAMQIDEEWWAIQAEVLDSEKVSYDINTLTGCLNMALWVLKHQGIEAWSDDDGIREKANRKPIKVVAPVGKDKWSEKIATPGHSAIAPDGLISIRTRSGETHDDGPGVNSPGINSKWVQFQSKEKEAVNVTVSRGQ